MKTMRRDVLTGARMLALAAVVVMSAGCSRVYYDTMERFGVEKRDILVDRVEEARDEQEETKEQFKDALEQFRALVNIDGGELEKQYDKLSSEYDGSVAQAAAVRDRIDAVERVAEDLFAEWEDELDQYESASLRSSSQAQLRETQSRYEQLMRAMRRAESKINPVLEAMEDQVLFLKHNLNAQAIASLQNELVIVENDVATLIREMETSINEANQFISQMQRN